MKRALVIGAGGFIGHNLVKRLRAEDYWVKGVDIKYPYFEKSEASMFQIADASKEHVVDRYYDRIYQLGADMGGAGFIFTGENDAEILNNSVSINLNVLRQVKEIGCGTIFYSSSVCMYADGVEGKESDAYPANPPSDYGWEKLFSERLYLAYARNHNINIRIARFHNTFGENGTFEGGREKAPAAICRKVIDSDGEVEIWGDGTQLRPFIYIQDLLDAIEVLMNSEYKQPVNIGPNSGITVKELVDMVIKISGKDIKVRYELDRPTGGMVRNTNNDLIKSLGWSPKYSLEESITKTYEWIKSQKSA